MHGLTMVDCMEVRTVIGAGAGGDRGDRIPIRHIGGEMARMYAEGGERKEDK